MNAIVEMRPAGGALVLHGPRAAWPWPDHPAHIPRAGSDAHGHEARCALHGKIPGTDKPTLYKNGAEVLCMVFRIAQSHEVVDMSTADVVRYRSVCTGTHQVSGLTLWLWHGRGVQR